MKWFATFKDSYDNEIAVKRFSFNNEFDFGQEQPLISRTLWYIDIEAVTGECFAVVGDEFHEIGDGLTHIQKIVDWEVRKDDLTKTFFFFGQLQNGGTIDFKLKMITGGGEQCEKHQRKRLNGSLKKMLKALKTWLSSWK